ncbi:MAG: DHH family phosphoesterase [Candidatus Helarchaeota archaeon]
MSETKKPLISLTHIEDLDGIGSQAILLRKFPKLSCFQSLYSQFIENIKNIYKLSPKKLFITDIGFNKTFKNIFAILGKMDVCWIDHHLISESDNIELKKFVPHFIHSNDETVTAELTQQLFLPNDEIAKKIAKLAHYGDNSIKNEETDHLQAIIELNQNNKKNIQIILELLSKGEFENKWFKEQYDIYSKKALIEFKLLENRIIELKIKNKKIIISFSSFFTTGKQTKYLMNNFDADIIFGVNPVLKTVSMKTIIKKIYQ